MRTIYYPDSVFENYTETLMPNNWQISCVGSNCGSCPINLKYSIEWVSGSPTYEEIKEINLNSTGLTIRSKVRDRVNTYTGFIPTL